MPIEILELTVWATFEDEDEQVQKKECNCEEEAAPCWRQKTIEDEDIAWTVGLTHHKNSR